MGCDMADDRQDVPQSEAPPTEESVEPQLEVVPVHRRSLLGRLGCYCALLIWGVAILSPCFIIALVSQGEITITLGSAPGHTLRIWLIDEADNRGLAVSRPTLVTAHDDRAVCVQTDVGFVLWLGQAEGNRFCECYTRSDSSAEWQFSSGNQGNCVPPDTQ
jgi:hypothetical protein